MLPGGLPAYSNSSLVHEDLNILSPHRVEVAETAVVTSCQQHLSRLVDAVFVHSCHFAHLSSPNGRINYHTHCSEDSLSVHGLCGGSPTGVSSGEAGPCNFLERTRMGTAFAQRRRNETHRLLLQEFAGAIPSNHSTPSVRTDSLGLRATPASQEYSECQGAGR